MSAIAAAGARARAGLTYRSLYSLDDCAAVIALERAIWGPEYDEAAPMAMLKVAVLRGGILIGAFEERSGGARMVGFAYSLCGLKAGRPTQWSFKLGVIDRFRNAGVGHQLKRLQRERALEMGCDLIEWTFDPLQAAFGQLNLTKLGVVVDEYLEDCYGNTTVPVRYRVTPTDRFVAAWHLRDVRVEQRLAAAAQEERDLDSAEDGNPRESQAQVQAQARVQAQMQAQVQAPRQSWATAYGDAPAINEVIARGDWIACGDAALDLTAPRLRVEIPADFSGMLLRAPELALDWRRATRRIFSTYLTRGYRVTEFALDRAHRKGAYILDRHPRV